MGGHWPLDEKLRAKDVYREAFYRGRCVGFAEMHLTFKNGKKPHCKHLLLAVFHLKANVDRKSVV